VSRPTTASPGAGTGAGVVDVAASPASAGPASAAPPHVLMDVYGHPGLAFVRGRGCTLWAADGTPHLDLAAGIDQNIMRLGKAAEKALMVITDEPTSMTDAYAFIKVLKGHAPNVEPVIAINQAVDRESGRRTYEAVARACQTFLGFRPSLAGIVLKDPKVSDCIRRQKTLASVDPNAQAIHDIDRIAEALVRGHEGLRDAS